MRIKGPYKLSCCDAGTPKTCPLKAGPERAICANGQIVHTDRSIVRLFLCVRVAARELTVRGSRLNEVEGSLVEQEQEPALQIWNLGHVDRMVGPSKQSIAGRIRHSSLNPGLKKDVSFTAGVPEALSMSNEALPRRGGSGQRIASDSYGAQSASVKPASCSWSGVTANRRSASR